MAEQTASAVANIQCLLAVRLALQSAIYNGTFKERVGSGHSTRCVCVDQTVGVGMHREELIRRVEPGLNMCITRESEVQGGFCSS